jgi:2-(1,2-epoxy-1,2-dihydrophenyl)acetyl-CoA isomerase
MSVVYEYKGEGVRLITLNRPEKLNAFNAQMRRELLDALLHASSDSTTSVVVLTGMGRAFCAGADLADLDESGSIEDMLNAEYGAFLSIIQTMPKPVIAAVNGPAAGIGMTLALTADLLIMEEKAYLMSAFANIGLVPDGGLSWLLTQQVGYHRAFQVAVEAEKIGAQKALEWGLANRVVAQDRVLEDAIDWARALGHRSAVSMALTKSIFRRAAQDGLRNAMAYEALTQRQALDAPDSKEGISALLEKRKPVFR